jgi:hypothetical protein
MGQTLLKANEAEEKAAERHDEAGRVDDQPPSASCRRRE